MHKSEFRRAQLAEVDELLPVVKEFYAYFGFTWDTERKREALRSFLQRPEQGQLWLAVDEGRIVGYAFLPFYFGLEFDGTVALLDEFYVSAECRRLGLGKQLLQTAFAALAQAGIKVMRLELDERHPEAASLYERLGFRPDGRSIWSWRG